MQQKTLMVVVPIYNMEKYLRRCLDSPSIDSHTVVPSNDNSRKCHAQSAALTPTTPQRYKERRRRRNLTRMVYSGGEREIIRKK